MGNQPSSSSSKRRSRSGGDGPAERAKQVVGSIQEEIKRSVKKLDDDHPAAQLIDQMCGGALFDDEKYRPDRGGSFYSEDAYSEDGSRTVSEDDTYDDRSRRSRGEKSVDTRDTDTYATESQYDDEERKRSRKVSGSFDTEEESKVEPTTLLSKPLASSFAKRCYFTKSGIGKTTQHYEGLTLTGNVVLMLAAAMKLKGCPTICDEDLRRVEQTYPNQFSRLPDELLLSSGWRRISKYCHFSNKPIPDGVPFFHSKQRLHPSGGYYFLLASAVGMTRPLDVEPLNRDTLVLLETDFPSQCDAAPSVLSKDPDQWVLVNKFCFFSGGPINTEEDVYYQADFDGNPIFMLAFLSPSLTPEELYKLGEPGDEPGLKSVASVQEVESVYDLTERDFDDLKLYHLGPCRALPQYILQPQAWTKVLPPHFLAARQQAMIRAEDWEARNGGEPSSIPHMSSLGPPVIMERQQYFDRPRSPGLSAQFQREVDEEGAFHDSDSPVPMDEAVATRYPVSPNGLRLDMNIERNPQPLDALTTPKLDPPDDEPPSLMKGSVEEASTQLEEPQYYDDEVSYGPPPDPEDPVASPEGGELSVGSNAYYEEEGGDAYFDSPPKQHGYYDAEDIGMSPDDEPQYDHDQFDSPGESEAISPNGEMQYLHDDFDSQDLGNHVMSPDDDPHFGHGHPAHHFSTPKRNLFIVAGGHPPHEIAPHINHHDHYVVDPDDSLSPSNADDFVRAQGLYPMSPNDDQDMMYEGEEKKYGLEDEPEGPPIQYAMSQESDTKSGEDDFIPIKRGAYNVEDFKVGGISSAISPRSNLSEGSHQSAALRGAQEILKKNRRRRMEMALKHHQQPRDQESTEDPAMSPRDDQSGGTWESGSELSGSNVSAPSSSGWSENSGTPGEKGSRRALILQMAKARMRHTKDSSSVAPQAQTIEEEASSVGGRSENNTDIDFSGDLD